MVETGIQSSFIPQDAGQVPLRSRRESGGLAELLLLLGIVVLVASVALSAGVFLYQQFLQSQAASKEQQIARAENDFQQQSIDQITRLNARISAAEMILKSHIAPSVFLNALDQTTLQTISFKSLSFQFGASGASSAASASTPASAGASADTIALKLEGVAQSVNSIAYESSLFGQSGIITNPIFSGINRQPDGVHFEVDATINPAAINYGSFVKSAGVQQIAPVVPAATSSATSTQTSSTPAH